MKVSLRTAALFTALCLLTAGAVFGGSTSAARPTTSLDPYPAAAATGATNARAEAGRRETQAATMQTEAARLQQEASLLGSLGRTTGVATGSVFGTAGRIMVIPVSEMKPETLLTTIEDMTIMGRILDRNLGQVQSGVAWWSGDFLGQSRAMQALYLEGYGALFLKRVDFPLLPGPKPQEGAEEPNKASADAVWDQMKRDIYAPQADIYGGRRRPAERPEERYDAQKVESLKTDLANALAHASNIRSLKAEESVIVAVTGSAASGDITVTGIVNDPRTNQVIVQERTETGMQQTRIVSAGTARDLGNSGPAVLVVRAKKSDIDALAKGTLNSDQFRQRVQMLIYPSLGDVTTSASPMLPSTPRTRSTSVSAPTMPRPPAEPERR